MKGFHSSFILFIISSVLLSGCSSLSPGMHMDTHRLTPAVNADNQIVKSNIVRITASLILYQNTLAMQKAEFAKTHYHPPAGFTTSTRYYAYQVQPQDVLQIKVWNQSDTDTVLFSDATTEDDPSEGRKTSEIPSAENRSGPNSPFFVNSRGNIYYPYLGSIHVLGKTASEIRKIITRKMSHHFANPQVTVSILSFNSQQIAVTGAVLKPTTIPITNVPLTILTAVTDAGGPIRCGAVTSLSNIETFCADLHEVEIKRNNQVVKVNLNRLTAIDGSSNNWVLKNGDVVYVPNNNASRIFVLGAVNSPNPYNMIDGRMTLREALGNAKGMTITSNPKYTYVIRDYGHNPAVFVLDLSSPDALNLAGEFSLKPGDVVYVSLSALSNFNEIINEVTPMLLSAAAIKSFTN